MKKAWFIAGLGLFAVLDTAAGQDRLSVAGDKIAIYNVAGEVRVEPGQGPNVIVEIMRGGGDAERLRIDRKNADGWQQVIVHYPDDRIVYRRMSRLSRSDLAVREDGTFGMRNLDPSLGAERIKKAQGTVGGRRTRVGGSGRGLEAYADIRILVPEGRNVAVHLGVGKLNVTHVNGGLQLDARSAAIQASDVAGFGRFDTGSGSIAVSRASGDFGLHTGSGGVTVSQASNGSLIIDTGSGSVQANNLALHELFIHTGSGGVTVDDVNAPATRIATGSGGIRATRFSTRNFDLRTGSGSVRVELLSDIDLGSIDTGSGSVTILARRELGTNVTVDTGSGGINVDMPSLRIDESRRSFLRGRIGDGEGNLRINTGSGGVSFRSF